MVFAVMAVLALVGAAVVLLAGGDDDAAPPPGPSVVPPGTAAPRTAAIDPALAPLTGLPFDGPVRPPLMVKIDNVDAARPQTGLSAADIVIEELVEGGLTRLVAVYSSTDPGEVGPVRSARESDLRLAELFTHPVLVFSGGAQPVLALTRKAADADRIEVVSPDDHPALFERRRDRPAPHDLYARAASLWAAAGGATPPQPLLTFGPALPGSAVGDVAVSFPSAAIAYRWDDAASWVRSQNGTPHVGADGRPMSFANVVVLRARYTPSTTNGLSPMVDLGRGGAAQVYRNGSIVDCTWSVTGGPEPRLELRDANAQTCTLEPGRTVIELPAA